MGNFQCGQCGFNTNSKDLEVDTERKAGCEETILDLPNLEQTKSELIGKEMNKYEEDSNDSAKKTEADATQPVE